MSRKIGSCRMPLFALALSAAMATVVSPAFPQGLTVDQIIEKNIAARGGMKAWRDIQTLTMTGKMDAGSKKNVQLPFALKLKRPRMSRLELEVGGQKALQIYDGSNGWKVRPFLGRDEVEPFTATEIRAAAQEADLDGFLLDHEAKGIKVELMGTDSVEGKDAYRLKLTMKDGQARNLWVDTQSFLEVKIEDPQRRLDGKQHNVATYYRNYQPISGLRIPFVLETVVENVQPSRKITIEKVVLNPKLEENAFAKPDLPGRNLLTTVPQSTAQVSPSNPKEASGEKVRQ